MKESLRKKLSIFCSLIIIASALSACDNGASAPSTSTTDNIAESTDTAKTTAEDSAVTDEPATSAVRDTAGLEFSAGSGVYAEEFTLEISYAEDAAIYYTTDGSDPTTSSTRKEYSEPVLITDRSGDANYLSAVDPDLFDAAHEEILRSRQGFDCLMEAPADDAVDKCTVVRAAALKADGTYSGILTSTYFIGTIDEHIDGIKESCEAAGYDLAVISLSIDYDDLFDPKTGIYVKGDIYEDALAVYLASGDRIEAEKSRRLAANYSQRGREWEREAHVDFFESDGTETTLAFAQDCGIRIQGNYSRSDLIKSFRLYARSDYGEKNFNYAVFGDSLTNDGGEVMDKFKTLTLRSGGNCAFLAKFNDTYWQSLVKELDCETQTSRPCVVYIDGEYWGLYVLQEDYSDDYFEDTHGVNKDDVVLYKGDAETYTIGYKLDLGDLPEGVSNESYYFEDLLDFFSSHRNLTDEADYAEFEKLVDVQSAMDYFAAEFWINNKWDWPGKNWSMWKTVNTDSTNEYADGRWRFCFYDVEFGGVSGESDAYANTVKDDNYETYGMLDMNTKNPAVLVFAYLITNPGFRADFEEKLLGLSETNFEKEAALEALEVYKDTYEPLMDQFFERFPDAGTTEDAIYGGYGSYQTIADFLNKREKHIQKMIDYIEKYFNK